MTDKALLEAAQELSAAWGRECRGEELLTRPPWVAMYAKLDAAIAQAEQSASAEDVRPDWLRAVSLAYGHLWNVNNEPMAPVPMYSPEKAAYEARKALRELLTHEQRGAAINEVRAAIAAAQAEQSASATSVPEVRAAEREV